MSDDGNDLTLWADTAMFGAEDMPVNKRGQVEPTVTLLSMNSDPLGDIAAACMMYEGRVVRDLDEVTDLERAHYIQQVMKTHLKAPLEFVTLHFLVEGVTRSFTHQMVRQRTAVFAQESLRFAVKDNLSEETPLPPSLAALPAEDTRVRIWRTAVNKAEDSYHALVDTGIPAEDARGLLPHQTTTRLHYSTNLRGLLEHAGNRLCTQAQFEWRLVFTRIREAIRDYDGAVVLPKSNEWQFGAIADLLMPICYQTGKCEFKASFDRACSIRDRVEANHAMGRPSSEWGNEYDVVEGNPIVVGVGPQSVVRDEGDRTVFIGAIQPVEWLLDPGAAR